MYNEGFTDIEIATFLNVNRNEVITWRLHNKYPRNKKQNKTSTLRKSLKPEQIEQMLLFLFYLDNMGQKSLEAGKTPDISAFMLEYRNTNYIMKTYSYL